MVFEEYVRFMVSENERSLFFSPHHKECNIGFILAPIPSNHQIWLVQGLEFGAYVSRVRVSGE